ncbi:MAG: PBP1A family penicillin-binding protein [Alphaproteobacteria bacterium]|nr:PBP1A family penicillin-binding protein [Alphaproteobacteria bacterium]
MTAAAALAAAGIYLFHGLPSLDDAHPINTRPSVTILAADGTPIARFGGLQGRLLSIHEVPPALVGAVLSVENRDFYSDYGIEPLAILRAMLVNLRHGRWVEGASTITQQLAKNLFLTPNKTLRRKAQEAIIALELTHKYSKDQILMAYLNRVYFGNGAYGVDAAAEMYFNRPAPALDLFQSAMLAGLLRAPEYYSPQIHPERAMARTRTVLREMVAAGYIDRKTADETYKNGRPPARLAAAGDLNRYFADWVLSQIDGFTAATTNDLTVQTTLDPQLQLMAEAQEKRVFAAIPRDRNVTQAALVTEAPDGAVLAMIGGRDYAKSQYNRATQGLRQPGSTIKPFVYLAALENGYTPASTISAAAIESGDYHPKNYDHEKFGTVTLAEALQKSLNTATVRLLRAVGAEKFIDVARRAGFTHLPKPELSSALGADNVDLLELTNAYATLAAGGKETWPYAVLSIRDSAGNLLYQRQPPERAQVFSLDNIAALDGMLQGVVQPGGTGAAAALPGVVVAGKTGTTQDFRDAWFVGFTPALVTGVWMGNDDDGPMRAVTGGMYPAALWHDYMGAVSGFSLPQFHPAVAQSLVPPDSSFADMLNRWSSGAGDDDGAGGGFLGGFTGSETPVYNR